MVPPPESPRIEILICIRSTKSHVNYLQLFNCLAVKAERWEQSKAFNSSPWEGRESSFHTGAQELKRELVMMQNLEVECLEGQMWPPEGQDVVRLQTWQLCVEDGADGDRAGVEERRPREGLPAVLYAQESLL